MMISTRGRYALRFLLDIAEHQTEGYVPLKDVSRRQEISEKYLESIVKALVQNGVLDALRGKGGGYRLAGAPEECSIRDVLELVEGPLAPVACLEAGQKPCRRREECRTLPLWQGLDKVINDYLARYTLADLLERGAGQKDAGDAQGPAGAR